MSMPSLAFVALFAVSSVQACNPGTPSTGNNGTVDPVPVGADYEAVMDADCASGGGPEADVQSVLYANGKLQIDVEWVGGCEAPYFELCTYDAFGDGDDPAQFWKLYVDQTHEQCSDAVSQTLEIDISDMIDHTASFFPYSDGMHITVNDDFYVYAAF